MAITNSVTITDSNHSFSYSDSNGTYVTAQRNIAVNIFTPDVEGTYPVIFYSHGYQGTIDMANELPQAMADRGYIVVMPRHLDSREMPGEIYDDFGLYHDSTTLLHRVADVRFLASQISTLMDSVAGNYQANGQIALMGHSMGAMTAALLSGAQPDNIPGNQLSAGNQFGISQMAMSGISAAVMVSPQGMHSSWVDMNPSSWDNLAIPALSITGTQDVCCINDGQNHHDRLTGFELSPASTHAVVLDGITHSGLVGYYGNADPAVINSESSVADLYLDAYLNGNASALATISNVEDYALQDNLIVEVFERAAPGATGSGYSAGNENANNIAGLATNDTLLGQGGDDILHGFAGNDRLDGGTGNDQLDGGDGADLLFGQAGNDMITMSGTTHFTTGFVAHNVSSSTQTGTDVRLSLAGLVRIEDVVDGGADFDTIQLGQEGDAFFLHDAYSNFHGSVALAADYIGNQSAARFSNIEAIYGLGGNDIIDLTSPDYSLAGTNIAIYGGAGNDVIWGSDANETIFGGDGNDILFGGIGVDMLHGGAGADIVEFTRTSTSTSFVDFDPTQGDRLHFYNTGGAQFDASSLALTDDGMTIDYLDSATSQTYQLDIGLAYNAADFTLTLADIQGALDII